MDFSIQVLPIQNMRQPSQTVSSIKERKSEVPWHSERIYEKDVPRKRDKSIIHNVRVFQIDLRVLNIVTRVQKHFSLSVELTSLRWLIHFVSSFQILISTLGHFNIVSVCYFVEIVNLTEIPIWLLGKERRLLCCEHASSSELL
jgi:hypothetical protein